MEQHVSRVLFPDDVTTLGAKTIYLGDALPHSSSEDPRDAGGPPVQGCP